MEVACAGINKLWFANHNIAAHRISITVEQVVVNGRLRYSF